MDRIETPVREAKPTPCAASISAALGRSWMCDSCVHSPPAKDAPCAHCDPEDPLRSFYQARRAWGGDKYLDAHVRCPFYKHADGRKVVICEGPFERSSVTTRFYRGAELRAHMRLLCESEYEKCPVYRAVYEKYDD